MDDKDIGLLPVFIGTSDKMNTSEAFDRLILSKGLADTMPYDEFAVFWASKGITQFYKAKIELENKITRMYRGLTGKNIEDMTHMMKQNNRRVLDELHNVFNVINEALPQIEVTPEQLSEIVIWFYNSPLTSGRPLATPPGGDWIGILIGIFIGGSIARFSRDFRRTNRNRVDRDPSEYNQYRSYQGWKEEYVSDRYESWDHQNYVDIYYQYILVRNYIQMDGIVTEEESEALQQIALLLFGGGGGGGGGGGSWQ